MADARIEKFAEVVVEYCLEIKEGDVLLIRSETIAEPLIREAYRLAVRKGAYPHISLSLPGQREIFFKEAPDASLDWVSPLRVFEVEHIDAELTIMSSANSQELSGIDPARIARASKSYKPISGEMDGPCLMRDAGTALVRHAFPQLCGRAGRAYVAERLRRFRL